MLGATWLDDALVVIDSSLEGNEGRYCFTLGHELGFIVGAVVCLETGATLESWLPRAKAYLERFNPHEGSKRG